MFAVDIFVRRYYNIENRDKSVELVLFDLNKS